MNVTKKHFSTKQLAFQELFIGTLIYAVVLGFLNDYTSLVDAKSFSTIFFAAITLEVLTYLAFQCKAKIINWLGNKDGVLYRLMMFFCVWLIMFVSKFIFIWALDMLFGEYIEVQGFTGILVVVLCVTVIHRCAYIVFRRLGSKDFSQVPLSRDSND